MPLAAVASDTIWVSETARMAGWERARDSSEDGDRTQGYRRVGQRETNGYGHLDDKRWVKLL